MVSRFACSRLPGEKLLAAAPAAGRYLTKQLRKIERPFGDFVIPTNRQDLLNEIARACTCLMNGLQIRMLAASRREALGSSARSRAISHKAAAQDRAPVWRFCHPD